MNVIFRPLGDSDYDALADLFNEASIVDHRAQQQVGKEIREDFESLPISLDSDTLAVWDGEQLVGAVYSYYLPSDVREERCYVMGTVRPAWRGRGIGRQLMEWGLARAEAVLNASAVQIPKFIRIEVAEANESTKRLLTRAGLQPIRYFADLHRPLHDVPSPTATTTTTGVRIVPWELARNEEARLVKNEIFQDHWGSTPMTTEWWESWTLGFGARIDLSFFAINDDDEIVAYLLTHRFDNDDALLGAKYAWIHNIGTLKAWRGRGIASGLITTALRAYAAEELDMAALNVDSDSPTGAYRVYEALEFRRWRSFVTFQREVLRS